METWRAARRLARNELKRELPAYVFAFVLTVLFGLFSATFFINKDFNISLDIFYLLLIPVIGLAQSRAYFSYRYLISDPFTQRLFFLQSLPISVNAIVLSRFLLLGLSHIGNLSLFLVLPYIAAESYRALLSPGQFILFMLIWFGYSLILGSMYHYLELSTSGQTLFWWGFGLTLFLAVIVLVVSTILQAFDTSIVLFTLRLAQGGSLYPLLIFVTGIAGAFLWKTATQNRIEKRDLCLN